MTDIVTAYHDARDEEILAAQEMLDGWDDCEMEDSTDESIDTATNTFVCERCENACVTENGVFDVTCKFLHEHKVCRDCFSEKWCPTAKKEADAIFTPEDKEVAENIVHNLLNAHSLIEDFKKSSLMTLPSKDAKPVIPPITTSRSQLNTKIHPMNELAVEKKTKKVSYIYVSHNSTRVKGTCGRKIYSGPNRGRYCGNASIYKNNHQGRCDYHYKKWIKENPFLAKH